MRLLVTLAGLLVVASPALALVEVPVPEPASLTVVAVGAGAVIAARFWRK